MAQVRFRDPLAALGPDRADICPGEPTHHMPCLSQRDKEDRQCAASEAGSISQQQFLYTVVSPMWPMAPSGLIGHKEPV